MVGVALSLPRQKDALTPNFFLPDDNELYHICQHYNGPR